MMKQIRYLAVLLNLILVLMACQLTQQVWKQPAEPANVATASREKDIPTGKASQTEQANPAETHAQINDTPESVLQQNPMQSQAAETQMSVNDTPDAAARQYPPQSQAAEIRPQEMRTKLTHLSNLIGYQVLDENGDKLGTASDYIVNTCETYIIYILMEPVASLNLTPGSRVVIPFEALTINSGVLDAQNKAFQLRLIPAQFSGAPTFSAGQQLMPTDWEGAVKSFWSKAFHISNLGTNCNTPGGPVYKVAYATQLLGVELYDGLNGLLGAVQEAILEPESGKVSFYIVKPAKGDGLVMVHLRAINIPKEALLPGGSLTLVLLTDPQVFWEAARITSVDEADNFALQSKMRQYWDR